MPHVNLIPTIVATTDSAQPTQPSDDLNFGIMVVGTAGAPADVIYVGSADSTAQYCHGWFGFNLGTLPIGAIITNATIYLTNIWQNSNSNYAGINLILRFFDGNEILDSSTIQWNDGHETNLTTTYNFNWDTLTNWQTTNTIDVTSTCQTKLVAPLKYVQWMLDVEDHSQGLNFLSSDIYLSVNYTLPSKTALFFGSD